MSVDGPVDSEDDAHLPDLSGTLHKKLFPGLSLPPRQHLVVPTLGSLWATSKTCLKQDSLVNHVGGRKLMQTCSQIPPVVYHPAFHSLIPG
jgi:hypothetical protein